MEFVHRLGHLFAKFHCHCIRFIDCMQNRIKLVTPYGPSNPNMVDQKGEANACESCNKLISSIGERVISGAHDVEMAMRKLGLWNSEEETGEECGGRCKACRLMDEAYILLEEKEATLEELEEAFAVFDEDGDGFISDKELRSVMQKLGFEEGKELEDCKKMLRAYDEDGDGKINFKEFKKMLEFAI
ncbi:calmodulin-like protein 7 [Phoenix dactylifera]|uniref:Calmodulin-like protein 7 n=1 Tax=Phoenix dactylifera TaxID=42345 RepID=A0A8B7CEE8_PHODC|nr:calmodulin-like protein 7 [Phoenix dactylifera]